MPFNLDGIRARFQQRQQKKPDDWPDGIFIDFLLQAFNIATASISRKYHKEDPDDVVQYKKIAANNFIVNCVTALEVYFKEIIIENSNWDENGLTSLLKEKITLAEAYDLFNKEKLTREYIVSHYYSFQNVEAIASTFSKLTDCDFFRAIEMHFYYAEGEKSSALVDEYPEWRKHLAQMYEVRNRFVHDGIVEELNMADIEDVFDLVTSFESSVNDWLDTKYNIALQMDERLWNGK